MISKGAPQASDTTTKKIPRLLAQDLCTPVGIRTRNLCLRRATLYPVALRVRGNDAKYYCFRCFPLMTEEEIATISLFPYESVTVLVTVFGRPAEVKMLLK